MLALGLNSGSSFDGIDVVLVDIDIGEDFLLKRPRLKGPGIFIAQFARDDAPDIEEGVRGMRFVAAVVASSRSGSAWTAL